MEIKPVPTRVFREGESLFHFLDLYLTDLAERDIVVITSKVIALSQKRTARYSLKEKERYIKKESCKVIKTDFCYLSFKDGEWCVNAGVDESNAKGKIILLPKDPKIVALGVRHRLQKRCHLKNIGVIITDTRSVPLRLGTMGVALSWSGFEGFKNYIGKKDLFKKTFKYTQSNMADALAVAAVAVMGEGAEQIPVAIIRKAPVDFSNRSFIHSSLSISPSKDLYRPVYIID